eukprot:TRINITY_DN36131_c0_g1_i7.p1 TRINITY_DN36131_c0_g1~~TRINITY_DN36131_c0_g1_i7.p1  ORF type:complete len:474 (+),score=75.48 TRINITY_DN36131_c0_g1_i7:364-1785(+)
MKPILCDDHLSVKPFTAKVPVSIRGCKSALELATAAASDPRLRTNNRQAKCCLLDGKLLAALDDVAILVTLLCAQLVSVAVPRRAGREELTVIVIIPKDEMEVSGNPEETDCLAREPSEVTQGKNKFPKLAGQLVQRILSSFRASRSKTPDYRQGNALRFGVGDKETHHLPDLFGWIFCCPSCKANDIMKVLTRAGCYLSGSTLYQVSYGFSLGAGGFGTVALGHWNQDQHPFAVKLPHITTRPSDVDAEIKMLVLAQRHANIVSFQGCICEQGDFERKTNKCILLDYYRRGDLFDHVKKSLFPMPESDAMPWMQNLMCALCHLYDRGIFHRDVKPENLLVGTNDELVLADFGVACLVSDTEMMSKCLGSLGYCSPEMLMGTSVGCQGDAFGAGAVLYFMLSKAGPFDALEKRRIVQKTMDCQVDLRRACFQQISETCRSLILGLLTKCVSGRMTCQESLMILIQQMNPGAHS